MADDATIIAKGTKELLETLKLLKKEAKKNDLELNKEKTKILIVRGPQVQKIGEYEVIKEVKYLGIKLGGKGKNIFAAENRTWLEKAEKKAREIIGNVKSSCDVVLVGKAIWKTMAIPQALYGRAVIPTSETDIIKLQRIENRVWRLLLGIGGYSTVESLRGEIGASSVRARIMESMLAYIISVNKSKFENIKDMMHDAIRRKKGKWYRAVNRYRMDLGLSWNDLFDMDRDTLKKYINNYDTDLWEKNIRKVKY